MAEKDEGDKETQPVIETAETEGTTENLSASPRAETSRSRSSDVDDKILSKESEEFESMKSEGRSLQILDEEENSEGQPSEKNGASGKATGEEAKEKAKETTGSKAEGLQQSRSLEPLRDGRRVDFSGRGHRHCQRRFREMIGKRELRKEELGKLEGDLRTRLNMLECSMPAVMVWNVWRMAQSGMPLRSLHRTIEKQFQLQLAGKRTSSEAGTEASRHYDLRVRQLEAERKMAQKRADEARAIWTEKQSVLEVKRKRLEEAKKIQQEVKERIEELDEQARKLKREAQRRHEKDQECVAGECGDVKCRERWLERVTSSSSIESSDLECLERLEELAEAELSLKKQIAELERREESYMRALQQADELWAKHEGDTTSAVGQLQGQLSTKLSANQELADRVCQLEDELEIVRKKLTACKAELAKYTQVKRIEKEIGREGDFAEVAEKAIVAQRKTAEQKTGKDDDVAEITTTEQKTGKDDDVAEIRTTEQEVSASPRMEDAETTRERIDTFDVGTAQEQVDSSDAAVDRQVDLMETEEKTTAVKPEDISDVERQIKLREAEDRKTELRRYLSMLGSLSELYKDDDYGVCAPDFPCNDLLLPANGLEEEEELPERFEEKPPLDKVILLTTEDEEQPLAKVPGDIHLDAVKSTEPTRSLDSFVDELQVESMPPVTVESVAGEDIDTADKPATAISARESAVGEVPGKLIDGVSEAKEITAEAEIQTVRKTVDQMVGGQGAEDVAEVDREAALKHLASEERGKEVVRDVIAAETEHANELAEMVDSMRTVKSKEIEVGENDAVVPFEEIRSWFDQVLVIREMISKCPGCKVPREKAEHLAERIAVYGTIDVTEIPEMVFEEKVDDEAAGRQETEIEIKDAGIEEMEILEEMETKEAPRVEDSEEKEKRVIEEDDAKDKIPLTKEPEDSREDEEAVSAEILAKEKDVSDAEKKIEETPVAEDKSPIKEGPKDQEQIDVIEQELETAAKIPAEKLDSAETQALPTREDLASTKKEEDQPEVKLLPTKKEPEDEPAARKKEEEIPLELSPVEKTERPRTIKEALFVAAETVISGVVDMKIRAEESEKSAARVVRAIDPRSVARPYLAVAEIEEREKERAVPATWKDPCVCKSLARPTLARATRLEEIEGVRAITSQETQTGPIRIVCRRLEHPKQKFEEGGVTVERLKWRRRMKDEFLASSAEIQTEKPKVAGIEVKPTRVDEAFRARVGPTGRFPLIPEQEIKSHSYEKKRQPVEEKHKDKCTCCMCSNEMVSSSGSGITKLSSEPISFTRGNLPAPLLMLREMVEQTTAKVEKLTHENRIVTERKAAVVDQLRKFEKVPDEEELCICSPEIGSSTASVPQPPPVYRKRRFAEKRDMSCSTKESTVKATRAPKTASDSLPKYPEKVVSHDPAKETLNSSSLDCCCPEEDSSSLHRSSSKKTRDCLCGD